MQENFVCFADVCRKHFYAFQIFSTKFCMIFKSRKDFLYALKIFAKKVLCLMSRPLLCPILSKSKKMLQRFLCFSKRWKVFLKFGAIIWKVVKTFDLWFPRFAKFGFMNYRNLQSVVVWFSRLAKSKIQGRALNLIYYSRSHFAEVCGSPRLVRGSPGKWKSSSIIFQRGQMT